MRKFLAAVLLACAPAIGYSQTLGSGTVNFQFTGFSGPLAASTYDNLYNPSAWIVPGLLGLVSAVGIGWKVAQAVRGPGVTPAVAVAGAADASALAQVDDELRDLD